MITRFGVQNYKALRDIALELTPIHALIGPNDSGKTSILNAIAALSRSTDYPLQQAFTGLWIGRELVWHGGSEGTIRLSANSVAEGFDFQYTLECRFPNTGRNVLVEQEYASFEKRLDFVRQNHQDTLVRGICVNNENASEELKNACRFVHNALAGVHYHRWNARNLALPVAPDSTRRFRLNPDGFGLALFLDGILGFDRELFGRLENKFCSIFPEIVSIKLIPQMGFRSTPDNFDQVTKLDQADGKGLYFQLRDSKQPVPAAQASDGALLILGYLAVLFSPEPPRLLLIEEPENGIHPKRLQEVLDILRQLVLEQPRTQVIFTTHSPYAVDLLDPKEVTLCTKLSDGSVSLTRMSDSPMVGEQKSVFTLGEIWTAEGDDRLANKQASSAS
jgi:predicted ATPase